MPRHINTEKPKSEAAILREIRLALGQSPWHDYCDFERVSNVATRQAGAFVRGGMSPGAADLIGCVCGRYVALEVKTAKGILSPNQVRWHARMRRVRATVAVVRSVEQALDIVRGIIRVECG